MATEETGLLDKQDFLEQKDVIKKQILSNGKLTGAQKRQTLQVLAGFGKKREPGRRTPAWHYQGHAEDSPARIRQNERGQAA